MPPIRTPYSRWIGAATALVLAASFADETPPDAPQTKPEARRELPVVVVTAVKDPAPTAPSLETAQARASQVPGGAHVIDTQEIKKGRTATLHDALGFSPGVHIQSRFGAEEARLSIRGSGIQRTFHGRGIKLLQDGAPLNLADGSFDFQAIEPLASKYVEVFRGANALQHGGSTLGGAVNFVSPTGYDTPPAAFRFETGSFGYLRLQGVSAGVSKHGDHYASLSHFSSEGYRRHSHQNAQRFFGNLGLKLEGGSETRFYLTAVETDSKLPGNLTKAEMKQDPRLSVGAALSGNQKRDFEFLRLSNRTAWGDADRTLEWSTFHAWKDLDHPINQVLDILTRDFGTDLKYTDRRDRAGRPNTLTLGLESTLGFTDDHRYLNVSGHRGNLASKDDQRAFNVETYGENQFGLTPNLFLVTGAQATYAERINKDRFPVSAANPDHSRRQYYQGLSPKLGMRWMLSEQSQLFGNLSRSFEPPSFGELARSSGGGTVRLDAQTATTLELGTRGREGRLAWDLAWYRAELEDELLSLNDAAGNPLGTVNADKTLHQGLELGMDLALWQGSAPEDRLLWRQHYLWSRFRFDSDPVYGNNALAGIPEHLWKTELRYENAAGFHAGPTMEWAPVHAFVDHANTLSADDYAVFGFRVGYKTKTGWSAFLEIRNLSDQTYAPTTGVLANAHGADSRQYSPGEGRALYLGVETSW